MNRLIEELKRRSVLRTATIYAAAAWLLVQVATQVFPFFDIPNWAVRLVVVAVVVGFPFALVISWFYQLTPAGFKREIEPGQSPAGSIWRNRAFRVALLSAAALALTVVIAAGLVTRRADTPPAADGSIAVLPFRNLSDSADNAYFAEGIQDEILTRLTRIGALRVIARNSTARYASAPDDLPKIARELGVGSILEGSVQRVEDEVHINVQLVQASSNTNLWSETYDRKLVDIFGVESEVAKAIAVSLNAALSGSEKRDLDRVPTTNLQAYDQYLRGMALVRRSFDSASLMEAAGFLHKAVELDPQFAEAWALLAQAEAASANQGVDVAPGLCDQAGQEAANALRLKPDLGEAHQAQGYYLYACKSDLDSAQRAFEQARLLLPGKGAVLEALGNVERRRGMLDKAVDYMRQAMALDPRNTELLGNLALTLVELRRFDQARILADQALHVAPDNPVMIVLQVYSHQAEGQLDLAQQRLELVTDRLQSAGVFDFQVLQLLYTRHYADAAAALRRALAQDLQPVGIGAADYYYLLGVALRAGNDAAGARQAFADGRAYLQHFPATQSHDIQLYRDALLCLFDAGMGDEAAAHEVCPAVAAAAASGGLYASSVREALARADALRGDAGAVVAALPELLHASYYSYLYHAPLTPALLRQDPVWDSVRADARFQTLAGEPAPAK